MLLFLLRLLKQTASLILLQLPLQLIGIIILFPVCAVYNIGSFPRFLRYFDSVDPYVGRDTSVIESINSGTSSYYPHSTPPSKLQLSLDKYLWTAFRNPINYFGYKVLGYCFTGREKYVIIGSLDVGDSTGRQEGFKMIELLDNNKVIAYEYLYVKRVRDKSCFYFRLGHKIGNMRNPVGSTSQQVFTISYRSYSGI